LFPIAADAFASLFILDLDILCLIESLGGDSKFDWYFS
jgi:hypothetical protein